MHLLKGTSARSLKRGIDLLLSAIGLVLTGPLLVLGALLIYLEDRGPVLYRQSRAGLGGRPFDVLKLRSMRVNQVSVLELGDVNEGHPLVTRIGAVLRRFKIDELVQLVNVLRGDMSLVGPRPTVPEMAAEYDEFQRRRLCVLPGMSGWTQVNGNNRLTWDERILLDVWYVDHWSLGLDVRIMLKTVSVVLRGERSNTAALGAAVAHAQQAIAHPRITQPPRGAASDPQWK
jgi:lipopolysaccharide/colanic/teichoic acid biosynthesis glycosyltransferase